MVIQYYKHTNRNILRKPVIAKTEVQELTTKNKQFLIALGFKLKKKNKKTIYKKRHNGIFNRSR